MTPDYPQPTRTENAWEVYFRHRGKRYRKRFPFARYGQSPSAAQQYIDSVLGSGENEPTQAGLAAVIDDYLLYTERIRGNKATTIRADRARLNIFADFCARSNVRVLSDISIEVVREFQEYYLANAPFSKSNHRKIRFNPKASFQKYRAVISALCLWGMKRKLTTENPAADKEFTKRPESRVPEIFTHEELAKLFDYFDQYDSEQPVPYVSTAFRFLAYTGARPGEMWSLRWAQVDLKHGLIHFVMTKTHKDRTLPISDQLRPHLERLPKSTVYVFDSGAGTPLYQESAWWKILDKALKATGIYRADVSRNLYTFRHTFAANLCLAGVPITVVKVLMGHRNIQTTLRYAEHFYRDDTKAALARLPY